MPVCFFIKDNKGSQSGKVHDKGCITSPSSVVPSQFFFGLNKLNKTFDTLIACSRLSDSGEDAKEKGSRKVGGTGKRKKEGRESAAPALPRILPCVLFSCLRFLNSADPTISEPGTG